MNISRFCSVAVAFVIVCMSTGVMAFHSFFQRSIGPTRCSIRSGSFPFFMSERDETVEEDMGWDEEGEEEEEVQQAYGNQSLEWTNKYRSVIPYEKARQAVMDLGLRSKEEWDEYVADGKVYHGPYLPNHPDKMYEHEWVSWDEFLGLMRPYNEAQHIVQHVLQLKNMNDYERFVAADTKRAEGLRIPAKPEVVYKHKGWISVEHFFGTAE